MFEDSTGDVFSRPPVHVVRPASAFSKSRFCGDDETRLYVCDEHGSAVGSRHHGSGALVEIRPVPDPSMRMSPENASVKNFGDEREKIVDLCATLQRVKVPGTGEGSTI